MKKRGRPDEIMEALRHCRAHFGYAIGFNALVNVLLLAFPLFSLQVYDRVLNSHSVETLIALAIGLMIALGVKTVFQSVRGALFVRASTRLDRQLSDRVLATLIERNASGTRAESSQAMRDLDAFRQFVTGKGALAVVDAPWAAFFSGILLILDFKVGLVALGSIALLSAMTIVTSFATKRAIAATSESATKSYAFADINLRGSEAIVAMGMVDDVVKRWRHLRNPALATQATASSRGVILSAVMGSLRIAVQAAVLAVGVLQIIYNDAPTGILFAAIIISGMAMRPIDQVVAAWDEYIPTKQALERLRALLNEAPRSRPGMKLPRPRGVLTAQGIYFVPPGQEQPILKNVNLSLEPGESLGLIGLNGSGKTTLARMLVGNLKASRGHIRLDGADVFASDRADLGQYIGYLPQNISILSGTVAQNIGRFGRFSNDQIVEAAIAAGVHEMILRLPKGYDTEIGEGGHPLSGGQRQLIGLARAIAGEPSLVVLDEPNSNLDGHAEEALVRCLSGLKDRKITTVIITHRPNLVRDLDHALVLRDGEVVSAGATENVFKRLGRPIVVEAASARDRT